MNPRSPDPKKAAKRLHKDTIKINEVVANILAGEHGVEHRPGARSDFCPKCQAMSKEKAREGR